MTSDNMRRGPRSGFRTPSYIGLTKALTTLLDRTFTTPYFPAHLSTPTSRLLNLLASLPSRRLLRPALHAGSHEPDLKTEGLRERHGQIQIPSAARPCRGEAHRCRSEDQGRHHHS